MLSAFFTPFILVLKDLWFLCNSSLNFSLVSAGPKITKASESLTSVARVLKYFFN